MKLFEAISNKPIVIVMGKMCSGKGTYCAPYTKNGYHHIGASSIVKKLTGLSDRKDLQDTKHLEIEIGDEIIRQVGKHDRVIIDGIRQVEIVDRLVDEIGDENIEMVWLDVPDNVRQARYETRGDARDTETFDDAAARDVKLGVDAVESKYRKRSNIVKHY